MLRSFLTAEMRIDNGKMRKWPVLTLLLVSACLGPRVQTSRFGGSVPPPWLYERWEPAPSAPVGQYLGKFKITFYWVVNEADYPDTKSVPLYDESGNLVGRFSRAFVQAFKMESAARLRDGRCISYLKKRDRVRVVTEFLGYGHTLKELRSVAVDPRIIPIGSRIYIPLAERVVVDGTQHTGVFVAHDIGSSIQGKRIDVFLGDKRDMTAFASAGMGSNSSVDVYLLE